MMIGFDAFSRNPAGDRVIARSRFPLSCLILSRSYCPPETLGQCSSVLLSFSENKIGVCILTESSHIVPSESYIKEPRSHLLLYAPNLVI